MTKNVQRRLAAILAADVVGYSRLMGEDEAGTLAALRAHREELIEPKIAEHEGRVVKLMGDGLLAEFPSAVEAVQCAVEIQHTMGARNADVPEDTRIAFRIGINIGDIIVEGEDIYGDGVNVAARMEGLAEPGGICVSRTVFNHVKGKVELDFEDLGEQRVKNIAEPLRVFRVLIDPQDRGTRVRATGPRRPRWAWPVGALAALIVAAGAALWWQPWAPAVETGGAEETVPPLPDKPSIAVLPFKNLSDDAAQDYFADGITEDLITDLSKVSGLFVIARHSVFTFKGKAVKVQEVAEELGVRYVLEGSVRRADAKIRINVQLIDATTGGHLWAERYDRDLIDIFALQDEVIGRVVDSLKVRLTDAEETQIARPPTDDLEAYDYYLRAERLGHGYSGKWGEALALYQRAITLDPTFAEAHAGLARVAASVWRWDENDAMPGPVARKQAYESASRALALNPATARAYLALRTLQLADGRYEEALESARKAVALEPNNSETYAGLAGVLVGAGRHDEAWSAMQTALRLDPRPPPQFLGDLGWVLFHSRRYEEAVEPLERARAAGVDYLETLSAVYARLGRDEEARETVEAILERFPAENLAHFRVLYAPYKRKEDLDHFLEGLRMAGIPEWPFGHEAPLEDRLDQGAVEDLAFGRTWLGRTRGGDPFIQQFSDDGTFAYRDATGNLRTGAARVEGNMYCERTEIFLLGRPDCGYLYRNPEGRPEDGNEYVHLGVTTVRTFSVKP